MLLVMVQEHDKFQHLQQKAKLDETVKEPATSKPAAPHSNANDIPDLAGAVKGTIS